MPTRTCVWRLVGPRSKGLGITSLACQSLRLDAAMIRRAPLGTAAKFEFLAKKYAILARHAVTSFRLGADHVHLGGSDLYYDCAYGIAGYQRALTSHKLSLDYACVSPIRTVLDVGANVGYFSLLVRRVFPDATIHAFEPIPDTFMCLQKNLGSDSRTHLYNLALSDSTRGASMTFDPAKSALSTISKVGMLQVSTTTLDDVVRSEDLERIDILKIDTEGFEDQVLRGGREALALTRYLFLEVTLNDTTSYTATSLLGRLATDGHNFQLVGLRNFSGRSEGPVSILDCVFENKLLA